MVAFAAAIAGLAFADNLSDTAAQMSEQSFALLNGLNVQNNGGATNPLLGPVASLSGDAESLHHALAQGDASAASAATRALQSDRAQIDDGLRADPKALKAEDWKAIKGEIDQLTRGLAGTGGGAVASRASSSAGTVEPPPVAAPPSIPETATASNPSTSSAPEVSIASHSVEGDTVRITGFVHGTALKSAGIFENGREVRAFKVNNVPGEQKLELDIGIENPPPDTTIKVTDADGRTAEASVTSASAPDEPSLADAGMPEIPDAANLPGATPLRASSEGGVDVLRGSRSAGEPAAAVAEIPSHATPPPSPSGRHTGAELADVEINIMGLTQTATAPPTYEVVGQIDGQGVTRAGIYVDGRLVKPIPTETSGDFSSFDQRFVLEGNDATVRVYGVGDQFVESSIDLGDSVAATSALGPLASSSVPSAPGIGVQITALRPLPDGRYTVSGVISGSNIGSAGLYQNGVLAQPINLNGSGGGPLSGLGGGLGGMLSGLIPGASRSVSFGATFSPRAGPVSVRAYDQTGNFTEQPVMSMTMGPAAPGNPYGGVPTNPYGSAPTNPYAIGRPPTAPSRPRW
jgi:hypothetical protein